LVKHLKQDEVKHEQELSREFELKYAELEEENERLKKRKQGGTRFETAK